jgi:hypothetical protein
MSAAKNKTYKGNQNDGAHNADYKAVHINASDTCTAEQASNKSAKQRSNNANNNVCNKSLLFIGMHDKGCNPTDNTAHDDPRSNAHIPSSLSFYYMGICT